MTSPAREEYRIGQLAKLAEVKPDTVRFYERTGLLAKPKRNPNGYRSYGKTALDEIRFIRKAQSLGFSLDEIRRILGLRGRGRATCCCVVAMAEATLSETEAKLKALQKFRDNLAANLTRWRKPARRGKAAAAFCALIESSG